MLSLAFVVNTDGGLPRPHSSLIGRSIVFLMTPALWVVNQLMNFSIFAVCGISEFFSRTAQDAPIYCQSLQCHWNPPDLPEKQTQASDQKYLAG